MYIHPAYVYFEVNRAVWLRLLCDNNLFPLGFWITLPGTGVFPPALLFDTPRLQHCMFELLSLVHRLGQVPNPVAYEFE